MSGVPRGIANCNCGNIRRTNDKWRGLRATQTDPDFFQFTEQKWGYRALMKILLNYRKKYGCTTVADYINRWAPSSENDTNSYIKTVCKQLQMPTTGVINIDDKDTLCAFAAAISYVENGQTAVMDDIYQGWEELQNG